MFLQSGIHDDFPCAPSEEDVEVIHHISAKDSLVAREVDMKPTRIFVAINEDPDLEVERWGGPPCNAAKMTRMGAAEVDLKPLNI